MARSAKKAEAKEVALFYVSKDKFMRAEDLVRHKMYKDIKTAYLALGGVLQEGHGYKEV